MPCGLHKLNAGAAAKGARVCRSREDASNKQLRQAAAMLREAAGVRLDLSSVSPPANVTDLLHQQAQSSVLTRKYPGLEISDVGNMEALKELAIAYDLGELARASPCLAYFGLPEKCMLHPASWHSQWAREAWVRALQESATTCGSGEPVEVSSHGLQDMKACIETTQQQGEATWQL